MSLSTDDVKKIAKLARIRLQDADVGKMQTELNSLLTWVDQLKEVNTDNVPEMAGVGQQTLRLREDKVTDGNIREGILQNAPSAAFDCFVVPKVVE